MDAGEAGPGARPRGTRDLRVGIVAGALLVLAVIACCLVTSGAARAGFHLLRGFLSSFS